MNRRVCRRGTTTYLNELGHRGRLLHTHLCSEICHRRGEAHPYDILHVDIIAKQHLLVVVDVDHTHQSVAVLSEIVEER